MLLVIKNKSFISLVIKKSFMSLVIKQVIYVTSDKSKPIIPLVVKKITSGTKQVTSLVIKNKSFI